MSTLIRLSLLLLALYSAAVSADSQKYANVVSMFNSQEFSDKDAILLVDDAGQTIYQWRSDQLLIPASLVKLATAHLAIEKLGLDYAFYTDFYRIDNQLWIKGYGDPYLVSEELDRLVVELALMDLSWVRSVHIDSAHFCNDKVPGRSTVNDPYNAPLSAVAANFNTVMLRKIDGQIKSGEPQTPLTPLAVQLAKNIKNLSAKPQRINLVNRQNAQINMAQLLLAKLQQPSWPIHIEQQLPEHAELVLRYRNTHTVRDMIRGMMEYSNNFIANQLFLSLADSSKKSFEHTSIYAQASLSDTFTWNEHRLHEGSGLSRKNRLSANQIETLLASLQPHRELFKELSHSKAQVFAKTGTLNGVRSFAGFINLNKQDYRFVFIFNRPVPWRHREQLLTRLLDHLHIDSSNSVKEGFE